MNPDHLVDIDRVEWMEVALNRRGDILDPRFPAEHGRTLDTCHFWTSNNSSEFSLWRYFETQFVARHRYWWTDWTMMPVIDICWFSSIPSTCPWGGSRLLRFRWSDDMEKWLLEPPPPETSDKGESSESEVSAMDSTTETEFFDETTTPPPPLPV